MPEPTQPVPILSPTPKRKDPKDDNIAVIGLSAAYAWADSMRDDPKKVEKRIAQIERDLAASKASPR
jgi:hypothetical protein